MVNIVLENYEGQCTSGFTCKHTTKKQLKDLKDKYKKPLEQQNAAEAKAAASSSLPSDQNSKHNLDQNQKQKAKEEIMNTAVLSGDKAKTIAKEEGEEKSKNSNHNNDDSDDDNIDDDDYVEVIGGNF
ncbi:hypothetical protein ACA910_008753 [Epithemia clementina (nom. ined.)]